MPEITIWIIAFLSIAGIIFRPFHLNEATWAVAGGALLVGLQLLLPSEALSGIARGIDVYLFLTGMMLLSETAREEKLFDWLAVLATKTAMGSGNRLFLLTYIVGAVVTIFLSNDATAVVLTPAVAAVAKTARIQKPLPFLLICAFIANAASFVLPISNPANLVFYGRHMPPLLQWFAAFTFPSIAAIVVTYGALWFTQRKELQYRFERTINLGKLTRGGQLAGWGIVTTAVILLISSALDIPLGLPTAITGILTSLLVIAVSKKNPWQIIRGVSWSVLPLVAGLFVIVEGLNKTGVTRIISSMLVENANKSINATTWVSGSAIAIACNIINNLPAGLIAANAVQTAAVPEIVKNAVLIGVDLGPNLSVTGSLATILWLVALRRENLEVSATTFFKLGLFVMTAALIASIGALWISPA